MPVKASPKGHHRLSRGAELQSRVTLPGRRFLFCLTAAWEEAGCDRGLSVPSLLGSAQGDLAWTRSSFLLFRASQAGVQQPVCHAEGTL